MQPIGGELIGSLPLVFGLIEGPGIGCLNVGAGGVLGGVSAADRADREKNGQNGDVNGDPSIKIKLFRRLFQAVGDSVLSIASSTRLLDMPE